MREVEELLSEIQRMSPFFAVTVTVYLTPKLASPAYCPSADWAELWPDNADILRLTCRVAWDKSDEIDD
jgi:hypothetical protein